MALTFQSSTVSANNATATAVPVAYPTSTDSGDLLVLLVGTKPFNAVIQTPSFWTPLGSVTNGSTGQGADTGSVLMAAYVVEAYATLTGNLTVNITSANSSYASMYRVTKASGQYYSTGFASGTDTAAGTGWSVTFGSNPGITSGDIVIVGGVWSTDVSNTISASAVAATSATFTGVVAAGDQNPRVTTNNQLGGNTNHAACSAGTASANPTWTATHTATTNNAGSAVMVRLREATPGSTPSLVAGRFG